MLACRVRPQFGVLRRKRMPCGLYTTSPDWFGRDAYLTVALAPAVALSALGVVACLSPVGSVLAWAFGLHLGACVGDLGSAWHAAQSPREALCEDLRDGVKVHGIAPLV